MVEPIFTASQPPDRRPALGYAMTLGAALLFGFNGAVSKVVLASGLGSREGDWLRLAPRWTSATTWILVARPGSAVARSPVIFFGARSVTLPFVPSVI